MKTKVQFYLFYQNGRVCGQKSCFLGMQSHSTSIVGHRAGGETKAGIGSLKTALFKKLKTALLPFTFQNHW